MVTVSSVASRSTFVHLRVEPEERKRWQEAARASGRSLSTMIRDALEVELDRCDHVQAEQVSEPSVSPPTSPARASLEERLAAIGELVDGLGVARPLPHPAGGEPRTEAASTLERLLTD